MPKFEKKIEIDAPVEKVWGVLTDPNHWPNWFPGVDSVSRVTAAAPGATFEWSFAGKSGTGTFVKVEPMKRLEILTQMGDDKDSHVFVLKPSGGFLGMNQDECEVEYVLDTLMGGGIIGKFVAGGNPKDTMRINKAMHSLRKLVEKM